MKILHIVSNTDEGGVWNFTNRLSKILEPEGVKSVTCYLYNSSKKPDLEYVIDESLSYKRIFIYFLQLVRIVDEIRPDIIIGHTPLFGVFSLFIGMVMGVKKRIIIQHNPIAVFGNISRWLDIIAGFIGVYSDNVFVSKSLLENLKSYPRRYKNRCVVIKNSVPILKIERLDRRELIFQYGISTEHMISHIGRLSKQKNQEYILELAKFLPNTTFILIGDGDQAENLKSLAKEFEISDRIMFLGRLEREKAIEIAAACDIFVFPSIYEGLPLTLLEMVNLGIPIMASGIPQNIEIIGNSGYELSLTDLLGDIDKIKEVIDKKHIRETIKSKQSRISIEYSEPRMLKEYLKLLSGEWNVS